MHVRSVSEIPRETGHWNDGFQIETITVENYTPGLRVLTGSYRFLGSSLTIE